ncbi:MAG: chromophore lyase CpcT/CpeT [Geminocystis sp.]|nr:chromophore lyase CpcT/CpeT [Geminocystis sp.]HIK38589.1 chromophore lyase CpcT/CpeT [Geminocystis sp. M7585_C2015_104]MCS7147322.1 chromophore lyase CpcT/CpeT [Geminocystis sp.]MCX8078794.1 chromophore lyase CpcT/CpeT [Geminocystis sp.]MDW8116321.1 chromophore lyase CpcT/CpeT [Geminocystis sp.]
MSDKKKELLAAFCRCLAGQFSNKKQAFTNPQLFAHIHVFFRPLPWDFFGGIGFYSEQVYDYDMWKPYRQGVHRLIPGDDYVYVENYALKNPIWYAGSGHNRSILETITPDVIERRYNCSMIFKRENGKFVGQVEGNKCIIKKGDYLTYLVSDVELTETTFVSWDRGLDVNTHQQKWGSEYGALHFEKITDFSSEIPWEKL